MSGLMSWMNFSVLSLIAWLRAAATSGPEVMLMPHEVGVSPLSSRSR